MSQFLHGIMGSPSLMQTGRSPIRQAEIPILGHELILKRVDAGTAIPSRVVILTALPIEFLAVEKYVIDRREIRHSDGTVYAYGRFSRGDAVWDVAIVETGQGNRKAATETQRAIAHFTPNVVLFVGIAGGRKDVEIGDVVVADKVYNYESGRDEIEFKSRPEAERSSYPLEQRARAVVRDWMRQKEASIEKCPSAFVGPIASGESVVGSSESGIAKRLNQNYGDALAVEKEGYGFLAAAREIQNVSALVIRGISDLLDGKEITDKQGSQQLAVSRASEFAFELLEKLNSSSEPGIPKLTPDQVGALRGDWVNIDLNRKPPETIAILRFKQYEDSFSLQAHHAGIPTFEESSTHLTLKMMLGEFGTVHPWSIDTIGNLEDYKPQDCMIGKVLQWIRYLQKQEPMFSCLRIEESQNSIVPWELLNLKDEPLGVTLQTVRSRSISDDEMQVDPDFCCQGQALIYASGGVAQIDRDFPRFQSYRYETCTHQEPEAVLEHFQQFEMTVGLVVMADSVLNQVSRGKRSAFLKRTKLLKAASLVMLQLSSSDHRMTEHQDIAVTFLEHGAKGVLGMLENVEGAIARRIMNAFFDEYSRDSSLPIPEIIRRLRVAIYQRLDDELTDEMSRLYLATFMYAYYGHPLTILQLTRASP